MKKEYGIATIAGLVIFGYILDTISGPIILTLTNPYAFLATETLSIYPLTTVSIAAKTLAIIIAAPLLLSFIEKKYIFKSVILFVFAALLELYAIQQLATGLLITPIQWTLSFAYAGIGLLIPSFCYLLLGLFSGGKKTLDKMNYAAADDDDAL